MRERNQVAFVTVKLRKRRIGNYGTESPSGQPGGVCHLLYLCIKWFGMLGKPCGSQIFHVNILRLDILK